eukprot:5802076-Pyramimonas_sp.AAC.1
MSKGPREAVEVPGRALDLRTGHSERIIQPKSQGHVVARSLLARKLKPKARSHSEGKHFLTCSACHTNVAM